VVIHGFSLAREVNRNFDTTQHFTGKMNRRLEPTNSLITIAVEIPCGA